LFGSRQQGIKERKHFFSFSSLEPGAFEEIQTVDYANRIPWRKPLHLMLKCPGKNLFGS
jgi:hypothetical protein